MRHGLSKRLLTRPREGIIFDALPRREVRRFPKLHTEGIRHNSSLLLSDALEEKLIYVLYANEVMESAELRGSHTVWKAPSLSVRS